MKGRIMGAEVKYIARDGRQFDDLKHFEQYEKALDCDRNTIEYVVRMLLSFDGYVTGVVICEHEGKTCPQPFVTTCLDDWLRDFVDVETLTVGERYIDSSTKRCAAVLRRKFAMDDPCLYILIVADSVDMKNGQFFYNCDNPLLRELWRKKEEAKKQAGVN